MRAPDRAGAARVEAIEGRDSLTRREREVANLITLGLTNQEIASRLVVSVRTVEGHLERILTKMGLKNRAQVAAWVATRSSDEHGS